MSHPRVHRTRHEVEVAAPAGVLYGLIADTLRWPLFFTPNVHVEQLEFDGSRERLRMWATANGEVKSWTSARSLDVERRRVDFRQEVPASPVESMGGSWIVDSLGTGRSRLTLLHSFTVAGDRAEDVAWVERATDTNSRAELADLKRLAEQWTHLDDLVLSFEESVRVDGPAVLVYDFLYRAADWPQAVPHVDRLDLREDEPGVQRLTMDTRTADGAGHTTASVRICFPHAGRILYKQTQTSALMAGHTGEWSVEPDESGVTVTARHHILLREESFERVLGEGVDVSRVRRHVRDAVGRSSTAVMNLAKRHAESAVRTVRRAADRGTTARHHTGEADRAPVTAGRPGGRPVPSAAEPERAARLETLLGDPFDAANPHGHLALLRADDRREVPEPTEALLAEEDLAAEFVPAELGGRLAGAEELARVLRPVFRRDIGLGYGFGITSLFAASAVWTAGDDRQRKETARLMLDGSRVTILHRELAHANAILRDEFTARPDPAGGGFRLSGRKDVVINADRADAFVMYARTAPAHGPGSHSVLLLDPDRLPPDGLRRRPRVHTSGMRSTRFAGLEFTGGPVPGDTLVGALGDGVPLALRTFQISNCLIPGTVIAGVDGVLRQAVRAATEGRADGMPARRWHKALAGVFADLLACDSMAVTGLRALSLLPDSAYLLAASVKYTMPDLLREDLEELSTVLGARGYDRGPLYGGFQKLVRDLPVAGLGHAGTAAVQAVLVPQLRALARTSWFRTPEPAAGLFAPGTPLPPLDCRKLTLTGTDDVLTATLVGAAGRLGGLRSGGPVWAALARLAEAFLHEMRALRHQCAALPGDVDPQANALADRYVLVAAAAACLGIREGQGGTGSFLEDPCWTVLALSRIGRRLGVPVPELPGDVTATVLAEVLGRYRDGRSFDLYDTRLAG